MTEIPSIKLEELSPQQVKLYRLMDNKSAESEWDISLLKDELTELMDWDCDLELSGLS